MTFRAAWALWLVFAALNAVLAGRWWPWLVPSSVPPVLFLLVPAAAAVAAGVRRVRSVVLWVSIAVGLVLGAPQSDLVLPSLRRDPAGDVRLVSWNTAYWEQGEDPKAFYGFIRRQDADVYLLQEYVHWNGRATAPIDRSAEMRAWFPGYQVVAAGELVTLSRLPVLATARIAPEVLRTDIRLDGRPVAVYNVHIPVHVDLADNPLGGGFWSTLRERNGVRQAQLSALRADLRRAGGPRLVAGDFNASSATGDLRWLRRNLRDAAGGGYPRSWPQDGRMPPLWRLDWCFVGGGLAAGRYELRGAPQSDHRLQSVRLGVPKP